VDEVAFDRGLQVIDFAFEFVLNFIQIYATRTDRNLIVLNQMSPTIDASGVAAQQSRLRLWVEANAHWLWGLPWRSERLDFCVALEKLKCLH
jgi:hypothetical protein